MITQDQIAVLIADSACINSFIPPGFQLAALIYLASQIVANGGTGTGSGATFDNYAGGAPTFTPASGTGLAVDTSDGTLWEYYNGAWH